MGVRSGYIRKHVRPRRTIQGQLKICRHGKSIRSLMGQTEFHHYTVPPLNNKDNLTYAFGWSKFSREALISFACCLNALFVFNCFSRYFSSTCRRWGVLPEVRRAATLALRVTPAMWPLLSSSVDVKFRYIFAACVPPRTAAGPSVKMPTPM